MQIHRFTCTSVWSLAYTAIFTDSIVGYTTTQNVNILKFINTDKLYKKKTISYFHSNTTCYRQDSVFVIMMTGLYQIKY